MPYCSAKTQARAGSLPSLKRKRQSDQANSPVLVEAVAATCFTNAAFSSTPKKIAARRRKPLSNKALTLEFVENPCLEVKSIADIVQAAKETRRTAPAAAEALPPNPYEVVRKPPKKKKREAEIVGACFENPALNLDLPEKQFNPYEVVREKPSTNAVSKPTNCFVNPALNLRVQDASAARNPYEIQRCNATTTLNDNAAIGVENLGLDERTSEHTELKIGLPFKPTLGCRIDFSKMQLTQLTPSKLLAEKLIFSPVPKRSLDSASEESSMDIGKELDRYQLELENSINEAKMRKSAGVGADADAVPEQRTAERTLHVELEQKITFTQKLDEIAEEEEEETVEITELKERLNIAQHLEAAAQAVTTSTTALVQKMIEEKFEKHGKYAKIAKTPEAELLNSVNENDDVAYASESSDDEELNFKAPAPFVRAYKRSTATATAPQVGSKESLYSTGSSESVEQHKQSLGNLIRKSIRKFIHPKHESADKPAEAFVKDQNEDLDSQHKTHNSAYKMLRNSLRRKPGKQMSAMPAQENVAKAEISIIDTTERTMKLKSELLLPTERKHTLRSSLRRSTREMGHQLMKSMFHKNHEAYELSY